MKTFTQWLETKDLDEDWRNWVAGGLAALSPMAATQSYAQQPTPMMQQANKEVSLDKNDLRKPVATVQGNQVIIKYLPSTNFGGTWKTGKNREVNEQLLQKYSAAAQKQLGINIGAKVSVTEDGKYLVWTLSLQ